MVFLCASYSIQVRQGDQGLPLDWPQENLSTKILTYATTPFDKPSGLHVVSIYLTRRNTCIARKDVDVSVIDPFRFHACTQSMCQ
jgi:hypothetical protein